MSDMFRNHKRKLNHAHKDTELNKLINQKHLSKPRVHQSKTRATVVEDALFKIDCTNNAKDIWKLINKMVHAQKTTKTDIKFQKRNCLVLRNGKA